MPKERPDETPHEELGYTPASPVKRTLAWIGLAYALLFLALTTYYFYTGSMLGNLGPLLAVPGLIGLGILSLVSWKTTGRPKRACMAAGPAVLGRRPGLSAHGACGPAVQFRRRLYRVTAREDMIWNN